jgi:hypothetical protein
MLFRPSEVLENEKIEEAKNMSLYCRMTMYSENENNPSLRKVSKKQKFNVGKTENIFVYPTTVRIKPKDI